MLSFLALLLVFGRSVFRGEKLSRGCVLCVLLRKVLPVLGCPLPVGPLVFYRKFAMKNYYRIGLLAVGVAGSVIASPAFAQASNAFTTAVTSVTADIATYGAALVGVAAVGVGFMVGLKYIKKIRGAA